MIKAFLLSAVMLGATFASVAQAQTIKPAVETDVAALIKRVRATCTRNLESAECGAAQQRLTAAVRLKNIARGDRETGARQVDALVASFS